MKGSQEETKREGTKPSAEPVKQAQHDAAALAKAKRLHERSTEGGKANEDAHAGGN